MNPETEHHCYCKPTGAQPAGQLCEMLPVQEFLADEPTCKEFWALMTEQFRTRSKFLAIWPCVRHVAVHRDESGVADGFLLVSAPVNWQIDYVVVKPSARGRGIAGRLVRTALHHAYLHAAPYVMLTCKESLRPLYEGCGFTVVSEPVASQL
jgi:GNAT superfamily N-acetyltransferase